MTSRSEASALRYGRAVYVMSSTSAGLLSGRRSDLMVGATGLGAGTPTFGVEPSRCCGWWTPGAGRALRVPRARTRGRGKKFVSPEIMISERPAEAEDRAVPGHWEGDLILGLDSSAIGTLVERTTRFTVLLHLPRMEGHGGPREHNGPALAGHGAEAVRDAIASSITALPDRLCRSLTWDQGAEMAQHAQLRIDTGLAIYFCDPHSPWQRGTNENTEPASEWCTSPVRSVTPPRGGSSRSAGCCPSTAV
jgi:hypothetical protein